MPLPKDINEYLRAWAPELGERILQTYPPLQGFDDVASPLTGQLLRKPFPAQTLARVRVFFIDGLRTPASSVGHVGISEVRLRSGRIIREGLRTTLTELRQRKTARTARQRWDSICGFPALFIVGRDRGKLSYFWRHAYT